MQGALTIAHVDGERGFSGGQVQVFLLLRGLADRGHRNVLCCPPGSKQEARARELGIETVGVSMRNDLALGAAGKLKRAFLERGADLVHLHTGRANWLGGLGAWRAGLPALTTRRMDHPVKRHLVNRLVYGRFVRHAVGIAPAVTEHLRQAGVPEEKLSTIWSAVDPEALRPREGRAAMRRALGVDEETILVLSSAHLSRRKGLDVALEALARVDHTPRWRLLVAGDGPELPTLQSQATALGLEHRVRFLGRRDDVPDLLAAADVFLLPSRSEGLGIAALEAMAAGRPVVASEVGGLAQAVVSERTGLLVPPEDPAALAAALDRLLRDAELRASLGAEGPRRIDEGFRADQMVAAYETLYGQLLGR